ncbi:hypothetical protein GCM10022381_29790 [Leifsonia kafniensis]|uniref:Uncharacterized protein n=1 Tax=Leifsonia kafniensis TaxID=475957 RepID=A0ABP7KS20_9MICO
MLRRRRPPQRRLHVQAGAGVCLALPAPTPLPPVTPEMPEWQKPPLDLLPTVVLRPTSVSRQPQLHLAGVRECHARPPLRVRPPPPLPLRRLASPLHPLHPLHPS